MKKLWHILGGFLITGLLGTVVMAHGNLFIYNWTDYTSPELIKKFEKETGINVTLDTFDSHETLIAKLKSGGGGYDISVADNNFVPIMIQEGLLEKINASQLKDYANIEESWKSPSWDPGNVYTIPWQHGSTSFSVDTEVYKGDINTFKILFEPPKELQGKIGMFDASGEIIAMALVYKGFDQCNENPEKMKQILELLLQQKPYVKVYNSDGINERLISRDTVIHTNWNGLAMRARAEKQSIRYAYPVEGVLSWMGNVVVPKGAKNKANAIRFIEFMLQPENAALQSNFARYANGIKGSEQYMDEDLRNAPELQAPEGVKIIFSPACSEKSVQLYDKVWTKLKQ
jgi:spermidine/putrescine transport system substrate-binding protein